MRALARAVAAIALCASGVAAASELNGFDLSGATVPEAEILRGGPPRDGIPALDEPPVVAAADAPWRDDEMVVGVSWPGGARAYPLAVLVCPPTAIVSPSIATARANRPSSGGSGGTSFCRSTHAVPARSKT